MHLHKLCDLCNGPEVKELTLDYLVNRKNLVRKEEGKRVPSYEGRCSYTPEWCGCNQPQWRRHRLRSPQVMNLSHSTSPLKVRRRTREEVKNEKIINK